VGANPMHPFLTIVYLYQNPMRGVCTHFNNRVFVSKSDAGEYAPIFDNRVFVSKSNAGRTLHTEK